MGERVLNIFRRTGAILEGHFLLTSGRHSGTYLEKFRILEHPEQTQQLCLGCVKLELHAESPD